MPEDFQQMFGAYYALDDDLYAVVEELLEGAVDAHGCRQGPKRPRGRGREVWERLHAG